MDDRKVEAEMAAKGLTTPRVTVDAIDAMEASLRYDAWIVPDTTTTLVSATLPSGFVIAVGKSAAVSKANFNEEIGYNIALDDARAKARDKLWELEGYALKKALAA